MNYEIWFITGSQHLYGAETLRKVAEDSKEMCDFLDIKLPCNIVYKPTVTTSDEITKTFMEANANENCIGIITWMHTFSPSKMWIKGLSLCSKPILHLHTQYNRELPFNSIDMDFMNLNQSAHGDREHGFIYARMRKSRKVVVGHWTDVDTLCEIETWIRAAVGFSVSNNLKVCRFGDNMREVAVTEGDKVAAQIKLGWSVNGYGVGDLVAEVNKVTDGEIDALYNEFKEKYVIDASAEVANIKEQIKYEIAMKRFLENGNFGAFTTTFEDLHGLEQLPGLAVQRLMADGFGFGGEGDWKTAAMVRIMKAMTFGMDKGTSFMEDYTYHLEKDNEMILGAHMLEVCPTISQSPVKIEVKPLGIGGKKAPARMTFDGMSGEAICVSLIDLGERFRIIINEVKGIDVPHKMPNLPVASVMWKPYPSLKDGAKAWILSGGAHHTCISYALNKEHIIDFARMVGIECVVIGKDTDMSRFETDLMLGDLVWKDRI